MMRVIVREPIWVIRRKVNYYKFVNRSFSEVSCCILLLLLLFHRFSLFEDNHSFIHSVGKNVQTVLLSYQVNLTGSSGDGVHDDESLDGLLRGTKRKELERVYALFHRVSGGLECVANAFRDHVNRVGAELVRKTKDAKGLSK